MRLFLSVKELSQYFIQSGAPLPNAVSTLNKDRSDPTVLGGVPYYRIGSKALYNPDEVADFYSSKAVVLNQQKIVYRSKPGKPSNLEQQEAIKAGFVRLSGKADVARYRQAVRDGKVTGKAVEL